MAGLQFFALAANSDAVLTLGERFKEAAMTTLQGMGAIFLVLTLLWICIEIMHTVLTPKAEREREKKAKQEQKEKRASEKQAAKTAKAEKKEESVAPVSSEEVTEQSAAQTTAPAAVATDDGALVAAITAAIQAAMAEEGYTGGFRVVSFKRVSANNRRTRV